MQYNDSSGRIGLLAKLAYTTTRVFIFMTQEVWKPVTGYEWLYEVSSLWRVKSLNYWKTWKEGILKPIKIFQYSRVVLTKNGKRNHNISRLVAQEFIPNPNNFPCACHIKEDLDENWLLYNGADNLFWWTHKDNAKDKFIKWRWSKLFFLNNPAKQWGDNKRAKKVIQYNKLWQIINEWDCMNDIERKLWIKQSSVSNCCRWKWKTAGWFIWKFG